MLFYFTILIFLGLCTLLSLLILAQESKTLGLGASLGGGGDSLFGTSTAQVLKKITVYLGVAFLLFCLLISFWSSAAGRMPSRQSVPLLEERGES